MPGARGSCPITAGGGQAPTECKLDRRRKSMKITKISDNEIDRDKSDASYFRGVRREDLKQVRKTGKVPPSRDLMPLDWEVIEYALGDSAGEMSEEDIESWVQDMVWWYDGSLPSIKGGVNITTDFQNAQGYGEYVLALEPVNPSNIADISDAHSFARSPDDVQIVGFYDVEHDEWKKD